ncbi:UDP-N-acetylmuramate--L-alanine ligase, partial [Candidatus Parcubacteria bacterium]|nr:UDP-N-acetylmuramate--L-alanine ligase [Candidatus Parcubacteria bacterium]
MIEYKNIYFIGIGGIGMSAIARMLREQGATVSGSDASESDVTRGLQESGIH